MLNKLFVSDCFRIDCEYPTNGLQGIDDMLVITWDKGSDITICPVIREHWHGSWKLEVARLEASLNYLLLSCWPCWSSKLFTPVKIPKPDESGKSKTGRRLSLFILYCLSLMLISFKANLMENIHI